MMHFNFDREYHIQIHHTKVAVIEWGSEDAKPIICLHGWLDNAASFHHLAPYLKEHYRLIAIEFPGHGQSEHLPPAADYQFISGISIIDGALDVLKIDTCDFLTHSMGAALAVIYAGVMPHRIDKLIAIDALGPFTARPDETAELLAKAIEQRKAKRNKKRYFLNVSEAAQVRAQVSELDAATLMPLVERGVNLCDKGLQWSSDSRLKHASWLRMTDFQLQSLMHNITAKVLFIRAKQGMLQDLEKVKERVSYLSSCEQLDLEGGHHLHMQYPQLISTKIREFLSK